MDKPHMEEWITLKRHEMIDARPWLRLWAEDVQLPDGRLVEGFYGLEMPDYVAVVAITMDETMVLERCYKHGPRQVCLNLPAGYVEAGEDILHAARRELREETGHESDQWTHLGSFVVDGNRGSGVAHLFLARQTRQVVEPAAGDLEEIDLVSMTVSEVARALEHGDIPVLSSVAALSLAFVHIGREGVPLP